MMNDGMLSQDEIDALLKVSADDEKTGKDEKPHKSVSNYLSGLEEDTLGEIGNISFGSSATTLSTLLNQKVSITTPTVSIINKADLYNEFDFDHVSIQVNYIEGFNGQNIFVIKSEDAAIIADIMVGGNGTMPETELSDIHLSAVQEVMNQMMGTAATSMSTVFETRVDISPPTINLVQMKDEQKTDPLLEDEAIVKVSFQLKVGGLINSNIMQLIPVPFAKQLVQQLLNTPESPVESPKEEREATTESTDNGSTSAVTTNDTEVNEQNLDRKNAPQYIGSQVKQENADVQQATFSSFEQVELNKTEQRNLDMLLDIPLQVTVELGRTKRTIKDILDLSSGSIIELDKLAGEPVDIFVNDKLIAKGEVVVIDENFGVRVSDIISQSARIMKLK